MALNNHRPTEGLPPYPGHAAHSAFLQLTNRRERYAAAIKSLEAELAETEEAIVAGFEEQDRRADIHNRVQESIKANRQRVRR